MKKNWQDIDTTTKEYAKSVFHSRKSAEKFVEDWNEVTEELIEHFTKKKKDATIKT